MTFTNSLRTGDSPRGRRVGHVFVAAVLTALVPVSALVSGCGEGGDRPIIAPPINRDRIIYADTRDPRTLDPANFEDAYDNFIGGVLHQGLVRFGDSTDIVPGLAESWEFADDGLSVAFTLRDAKFHNGDSIDAYDVKYSITRLLDPASGSQRLWMFEPYLIGYNEVSEGDAAVYAAWVTAGRPAGQPEPGLKGLETPDERTVVFRFNRPYLPFLTMMCMPNAAVIPLGSGLTSGVYPPGAGPWQFVEWEKGERLLLRRFDDYWEGPAKEPEFLYRAIAETSTWRAEFDAGNVYYYVVSEADYRQWRRDPVRQQMMIDYPELNVYYVGFNMERKPLDDLRVRKALSMAINAGEIFEYIQLGKGVRAAGPVPPGIVGHRPGLELLPYDPEAAKALLAEAGVENLSLSIYFPADDLNPKIAQAVAETLRGIGVRLEIRQLDRPAYREALTTNREPDLYLGNWWADYPDIENFIFPLYHSSEIGSSNNSLVQSPELDALIDEARFHPDPERRIELFQQAEDIVRELHPVRYLWHRGSRRAMNPAVKGFKPHPMLNGLDFHEVEIVDAPAAN